MELQIVSFELSKKLKEVGFKPTHELCGIVDKLYKNSTGMLINYQKFKRGKAKNMYHASTQALAQMWFREKHQIDINCSCNYERDMWSFGYRKKGYSYNYYPLEFKTYEEALEAGLLKACEII